jgi:hypothetical protein
VTIAEAEEVVVPHIRALSCRPSPSAVQRRSISELQMDHHSIEDIKFVGDSKQNKQKETISGKLAGV